MGRGDVSTFHLTPERLAFAFCELFDIVGEESRDLCSEKARNLLVHLVVNCDEV